MTDAERRLWLRLRRKKIDGLKFRRQHPVGPYVLDFYCADVKLCIEVDGGQHADEQIVEKDQRRTEYLEAKGITVLRCWNFQVFENLDGVVEEIAELAHALMMSKNIETQTTPSP